MATEVERLTKEIGTLASKRATAEQKRDAARDQHRELSTRRSQFLTRIADGDDPDRARLGLRDADDTMRELTENAEAFDAATTDLTATLETMRKQLADAEHRAAIDGLEAQLSAMSDLDDQFETSIAHVRAVADAFLSAITSVTVALEGMDSKRFDSRFSNNLKATVRETVFARFEELGRAPAMEKQPSVIERIRPQLQAAVAQLRYMAKDQRIEAARGERLYRATSRISGLRKLDLMPGNVIGLFENEADELLKLGSLEELITT